jgi:hypothetical protein
VKRVGGTWRIDASKLIDCWIAKGVDRHQEPATEG